MITLSLYFIFTVIVILMMYYLTTMVRKRIRKQISKNWKVGDVIIVDHSNISLGLSNEIKNKNVDTVELSGWNSDNVFYIVGERVFAESWSSMKHNKSDVWRHYYKKCNDYMGTKPNFSDVVSQDQTNNTTSDTIDGEPIETMSETMCQIHLKRAIEDENFELAEKLRKRLENFR